MTVNAVPKNFQPAMYQVLTARSEFPVYSAYAVYSTDGLLLDVFDSRLLIPNWVTGLMRLPAVNVSAVECASWLTNHRT